jgi:PAS domain S-box-containing protein
VVLVAIGASDRASDRRVQATRVIRAGDGTEKSILDMETGLRGYLLTSRRGYLAPWLSGRASFSLHFERLRALTGSDGSGDDAVVRAIGTQGRAYISDYGDPIAEHGAAELDHAGVLAGTAEGKRRVDVLRSLFDRLDAINNAQAQSRIAAARAALTRARDGVIVGLVGILGLVALAALYLVRGVSLPVRRVAAAADALSGGELSVRAPVRGPGEVAQLARSFNAMAAAIEDGEREAKVQSAHLVAARAEAEIVAAELAEQQDAAIDLVATVGFDGYFKRVNPAWERTLGYPVDELKSLPFIEYVHADDRERTEAEVAQLAAPTTETASFQNRCRTKAGSYRWLEWNVQSNAEQELLYAVARDVTERKDADEQIQAARHAAEEASLAKSEFLSRMSHELRTPLNAILGFGQLLEMDGVEAQRQSVEQILRGGRHLLGLIDEVLDISLIESGTMRMSVEPVDIISALGDAVAMIAPVAGAEAIELSIERCGDDECYVLADRQRLRQVILNLLSNAVKYNRPNGSVKVSMDLGEDRVRIHVADTGFGIAEDQLERLFVAFDRLGAATGPVQGTGLGLALSKHLVEEMGGALSVESTLGKGSAFTIELVRADNPVDETRLASARSAGEDRRTLGSGTILYIEDNPSNSKLVAQALGSQPDVRLLAAMQGSHGLELAKAHQPDLILLDLHLPDMAGSAVLERLQADPDTAGLPVIVLSADATARHIRELLDGGARAYLTKPLDIPAFLEAVNAYLPSEVLT